MRPSRGGRGDLRGSQRTLYSSPIPRTATRRFKWAFVERTGDSITAVVFIYEDRPQSTRAQEKSMTSLIRGGPPWRVGQLTVLHRRCPRAPRMKLKGPCSCRIIHLYTAAMKKNKQRAEPCMLKMAIFSFFYRAVMLTWWSPVHQ